MTDTLIMGGIRASGMWGLWALLMVSFTFVHQRHFEGATPVSRLDLLHALVIHRTFEIDAYHENTPDKALFKGHYYSDKAPGTVALALPSFAAGMTILRILRVEVESSFGRLILSWVACAGSNGVIASLGGLALFAWLLCHVSKRWALLATLAVFLGAAPLPYATLMFSHSLVVGFIAVALWAVGRQGECVGHMDPGATRAAKFRRDNRPRTNHTQRRVSKIRISQSRTGRWLSSNKWDLLGGHMCGWALASEYTAGIVIAGLFFWLMSMDWRRTIPFCLAALPPLLLIPAYSWACFRNPFVLPYSLQASFPPMNEGLYGIKWPDPQTLYNLLVTPTRGLFFWTPFLLMAGFGYSKLNQNNKRLFWLTYAVPMVQIVVFSGRTWDWLAGFTLGPRYFAPILPLLALPCALGAERFPKLGIALASYSVLITTLATLTDACPENWIYNPLTELHIPKFLEGELSPNIGMIIGLSPYISAAAFYAILVAGTWWVWHQLVRTSGGESSIDHPVKGG